MIAATALAAVLFLLVTVLHLRLLERALSAVGGGSGGSLSGVRLLAFLSAVLTTHLLGAAIFAVGFRAGQTFGLGDFSQEPSMQAMDYFYFSLINITTLGLGDIYPTQHLRVLAGIESLTGFLLISASASYIYKVSRPDE